MIATYSIWQIGLVWILGSFLLGATWIVLVRIEVYLNRRERRAGVEKPSRSRSRLTSESGVNPQRSPLLAEQLRARRVLHELDEMEWLWVAPYRSPLTSGRTRERRHRS